MASCGCISGIFRCLLKVGHKGPHRSNGRKWRTTARRRGPIKSCRTPTAATRARRSCGPKSSVVRLPRVKDKIIGVTLGGMRVTQKEFHLIQLAYHDGFQAGRKSRG